MKSRGKHLFALCSILSILTLTGCGNGNGYINNSLRATVAEQAEHEIHNTPEYKLYEQYSTEGILSEDGLFPMPAPVEPSTPVQTGRTVQITIANNSFLNCVYYTDEEAKTPILSSVLTLSPGDSLYIANVSVNNPKSNLYDFYGFRIWSYDKNNNRSITPYSEVKDRSGLLLKIPDDFNGIGFSIEPLGRYTNRIISARAFFRSNGQDVPLPGGIWKVNNKRFSGSTEISPVDSYTIEYDYSFYKDDFYFVNSSPEFWNYNEANSIVYFSERTSNEKETDFSVEMHPFITMTVTNSCLDWAANLPLIGKNGDAIIKSITVDGVAESQDSFNQQSFEIGELKAGTKIVLRVGKEYKITGRGVKIDPPVSLGNKAKNGYEYTIIVPDTTKEISIEITERNSNAEGTYQGYNVDNADVLITRENGTTLKIGEELPGDDEKVTITIIPHDGYYIAGYTDYDYSYKKSDIVFSKIDNDRTIIYNHPAMPFLTLNLVFSDDAGTYTYRLDGKEINDNVLRNVRDGQTLEVDFTAHSGYEISHSWFGADAVFSVWMWLGGDDTISERILITPALDGTSIDRFAFGIDVEEEG